MAPEKQLRGKQVYAAAQAGFGAGMLDEVRRFGADLVRFQVSQGGLDPQSPIYDPGYRDQVLMGIALTRGAGFNVIVSMQWQGAVGAARPDRDALGDDQAGLARASPRRSPTIPGIMLEIFNEPAIGQANSKDWREMEGRDAAADRPPAQAGIEERAAGRRRAVLPVLRELPRRSTTRSGSSAMRCTPSSASTTRRGRTGRRSSATSPDQPVMATAFNAQAGGSYCRPELPEQAADLLAYLHEKRIGLVAWALDMPNLRNPDGSYTNLDHLVCGQRNAGGRGGAGEMIHEYFLQN